MRIFGRILYATIMVGFFLLAFTYSRDLMQEKYLNDVFGSSLTDTNSEYPEFYYFYTSIPDYHNNEPIISIDSNGYQIRGYEVLQASINNDNILELTESVYIIVYSSNEDLSQVGSLFLENSSTSASEEILLQRFHTLNLINGVNDEGSVYIAKDIFFNDTYDTILLTDQEDNVLLETSFSLDESAFIISGFVQAFYDDYGALPTLADLSNVNDNHIFPNKPHVADDYIYIFYIAMGIYFAVLIFMTYIIFFRKRKNHY